MPIDQKKARELFLHAVGQLPPAEWASYVTAACAGDTELERQVGCLLEVHLAGGSFLESPAPGFDQILERPPLDRVGSVVGPYKLLQQLGEGGMGTVFMAQQTHPVQRKVALKVIKPGMDSRQVIARFEAERQALAMMDHVNIARVLDAGAVSDGRPFFVMELVHGVSITKYCNDHHLTPRQRLELFVPVCQAIQHAHQKGIIHRDIKPSNVMITLYDGKPVPKVIDFGVAKATDQRLTEHTLFTQYGTMVGTLEYVSPEQAEMSALGVDTRSDIYSLGVLLYELLTGGTPLCRRQINESGYAEIVRMIKEDEPLKPSTRLSESGAALALISAERSTEPARLAKLMRGELDWIVMKCLEKDRNRRYETANGLAADVMRYLNDDPVQACPPSAYYRLSKLVRRNKALFAVASVAALTLLMGFVGLFVSNLLIRQEQTRTRDEKRRAETAQRLAEDRAEEIRQGLERLKAANAWLDRGRWYVGQHHWDDANAAFSKAISLRPDDPTVWFSRGELLAQLGLFDLASEDLARESQLREPDTTPRWYQLALLQLSRGDQDGYRLLRRRMIDRFYGTVDAEFAADLVRTSALSDLPNEDPGRWVELATRAFNSEPDSWHGHYLMGITQYRAGQHEQAVRHLRDSLSARPESSLRAISYPVLAMAQFHSGHPDAARESLDAASEAMNAWTQERYQGRNPQHWVIDQGAVGNWPIPWWDWLECDVYCREAYRLIEGSDPADDARLHVLRARAFAGLRRNFTADVEYEKALSLLPDDWQIRLEAHRSAGYSNVGRRRWIQAATDFSNACELAPNDADLWRFRAVTQLAAGELDAYQRTCAEMLERFQTTQDWRVAGNVVLVCVLRDDALPDMSPLLPLARLAAPWHHVGAYVVGAAEYRAGRYDEAVRSFETAAYSYRPRSWDWSFLAMAHHRLGHTAEARRCLIQAARWIDDANRQVEDDLSGTRPAWRGWNEMVVYPLLLDEAQKVLASDP